MPDIENDNTTNPRRVDTPAAHSQTLMQGLTEIFGWSIPQGNEAITTPPLRRHAASTESQAQLANVNILSDAGRLAFPGPYTVSMRTDMQTVLERQYYEASQFVDQVLIADAEMLARAGLEVRAFDGRSSRIFSSDAHSGPGVITDLRTGQRMELREGELPILHLPRTVSPGDADYRRELTRLSRQLAGRIVPTAHSANWANWLTQTEPQGARENMNGWLSLPGADRRHLIDLLLTNNETLARAGIGFDMVTNDAGQMVQIRLTDMMSGEQLDIGAQGHPIVNHPTGPVDPASREHAQQLRRQTWYFAGLIVEAFRSDEAIAAARARHQNPGAHQVDRQELIWDHQGANPRPDSQLPTTAPIHATSDATATAVTQERRFMDLLRTRLGQSFQGINQANLSAEQIRQGVSELVENLNQVIEPTNLHGQQLTAAEAQAQAEVGQRILDRVARTMAPSVPPEANSIIEQIRRHGNISPATPGNQEASLHVASAAADLARLSTSRQITEASETAVRVTTQDGQPNTREITDQQIRQTVAERIRQLELREQSGEIAQTEREVLRALRNTRDNLHQLGAMDAIRANAGPTLGRTRAAAGTVIGSMILISAALAWHSRSHGHQPAAVARLPGF